MMAGPMASPVVVDRHGARPLRRCNRCRRCRSGATPLSASARRAEATMASHQACGDCSAPPSSVRSIPTAWKAWATIRPVAASTATFGPPVPRSTARTCGSVDSTWRSAVAVARTAARRGVGMARKRIERAPARAPGRRPRQGVIGQAGLGLDLDDDLVADHDAAVEQRVVEADAEVAPVDGRAGREGHDGLALLHGGALAQELEVEVDRLGDAPDGQVAGQHPVGVVDPAQAGARPGSASGSSGRRGSRWCAGGRHAAPGRCGCSPPGRWPRGWSPRASRPR